MSEPYVGEIRMFAGNFAPRGWAFCDGQLLSISTNDALFSLLGTIYGGDGTTTFGVPDLRGRIPLHQGQGPGLSLRRLGSKFGAETVTVTTNQIPSHNHIFQGSSANAVDTLLTGKVMGTAPAGDILYVAQGTDPTKLVNLINGVVGNEGGSQFHSNMMPTLCINYIIALVGIYPSRN